MKKFFEYTCLLSLTLFSFYYTDKVTSIMNSKDPIMIDIEKYKDESEEPCREGYITSGEAVLGKNGKKINEKESYSKMQGERFNKDLIVYEEVICKVNLETVGSNYIINANPSKNMISIFIEINDMNYIDEIINVAKSKNIKPNILIDGEKLTKNENYFRKLYNNGYDIVYGGKTKEDLKLFLKTLKTFNKNYTAYCMSINNEEKDFCSKEDIKKLRTSYYYTNDIYLKTKSNLEKGSFYIYKENKYTLEEISILLNFIKGKNIEITGISSILK